MDLKKIATEVLASNPDMESVFVDQTGEAWATKAGALTNSRAKGLNVALEENQPEEFKRSKLSKEVSARVEEIAKADAEAKAYAAELAEKAAIAKQAARDILAAKPTELEPKA